MDMVDRSPCIEFVHCMFLLEVALLFFLLVGWLFFPDSTLVLSILHLFSKAPKGVTEPCKDSRTVVKV